MISNELMEEVINVSLKDEFINQDLLIKVIECMIDQCSDLTKSKFNGVDMFKEYRKEKATNADYVEEYKIIRVYYLNIIKNGLYYRKYNIFETNLYMLQVILHEIEHLKADTKELTDDFESKLIKTSSPKFIWSLLEDNLSDFFWKYKDSCIVQKYLMKKYKVFDEKNWDICPDEKLAEAYSGKILFDSINNYDKFQIQNPEEFEFVLNQYFNSLLNGYKFLKRKHEYNVPLLQYLAALDNIDLLGKVDQTIKEEIKNIDKYSLEDRMKYGFPVTNDEVEKVKSKILFKSMQ